MAEFLSPAWVDELDVALRASALRTDDPAARLVVELEVHDGDRVQVHHLVVASDSARARPGPAEEPDLVLVTDPATAYALHRNEANAQEAIASGRLRVRGDLGAFSRHASTIASLSETFAALRATTTGPAGDDR